MDSAIRQLRRGRVRETLENDFGKGEPDLILLFDAGDRRLVSPTLQLEIKRILRLASASTLVVDVKSFWTLDAEGERFITEDRTQASAIVSFSGTEDEVREHYAEVLKDELRSDELTVLHGGLVPGHLEATELVERDLRRAELLSMPLTLIALLLLFGGIVAASLPVILGALSIIFALAALRLVGEFTAVSVFAIAPVTMLCLGLAIDYSLFVLARYREEMAARADDVRAAIVATMGTAGRAVMMSGLTTGLSLASLFFFNEMFWRSVALGTLLAVTTGLLMAGLVLPALIAVLALSKTREESRGPLQRVVVRLGRNLDGFSREDQQPRASGFWFAVSRIGARWPLPILTIVIAVLLFLAVPFLRINLALPDDRVFPDHFEAREVSDRLDTAFGDSNFDPVLVVVDLGSPQAVDHYAEVERMIDEAEATEGVARAISYPTFASERNVGGDFTEATRYGGDEAGVSPEIVQSVLNEFWFRGTAFLELELVDDAESPEARATLGRLRELAIPPGAELSVGGSAASLIDARSSIAAKAPIVIGYIILVTFVALLFEFRSVMIPIKAILLNGISIGASLGALVWVFQDGHLQQLLRFNEVGFITTTTPVLIFAIVFGISMDYEIFMLSRIRDEYDRNGGDTQAAVARGLQRTGRMITGAALLLVIVIGAFATSEVIIMKQIGLGLALAILIDATIVRVLLVPASMHVMGGANWWAPKWLRRRAGS